MYINERGERCSIDDLSHILILDPVLQDFVMNEVIFFEKFRSSIAIVQIGKHTIELPSDFRIVIYDHDIMIIDSISLRDVNDHCALSMNALRDRIADSVAMNVQLTDEKRLFSFPRVNGMMAISLGKHTVYVGRSMMGEIGGYDLF